jgi:putative membrane protein
MTSTTPFTALAQQGQSWDGGMMASWGWMWAFGLLFVVLLAALIIAVVWLVTRGGRPGQQDPSARAPARSSAKRYARGEISTEGYRERLDALR